MRKWGGVVRLWWGGLKWGRWSGRGFALWRWAGASLGLSAWFGSRQCVCRARRCTRRLRSGASHDGRTRVSNEVGEVRVWTGEYLMGKRTGGWTDVDGNRQGMKYCTACTVHKDMILYFLKSFLSCWVTVYSVGCTYHIIVRDLSYIMIRQRCHFNHLPPPCTRLSGPAACPSSHVQGERLMWSWGLCNVA